VSPDVGTLRRLYVDEGLSLAATAARLGVVAQTVHNWLVAGGVPRRPSPAKFRADIDDGEIIQLYTQQGHTAAEIAEQLGCSTSLVYGRLARRGVDRRPQAPRRRPGPTAQELSHLYGDCGLSLRDLAERYGVTTRAVRSRLVAAGIDRRPSGTARVDCDGDELVALYGAGWSAPAIADLMGCSPSTIYRRLAAAGIARRPARRALSRQDLIAGLGRGWSAPEIAAAHAVSVSCVCRALNRENLVTAAQALKQQMRLRYPEYYASPVPSPTNVSVSGNARP
jgi:DNA-directed RNA polymerase specialized sigma24 family protein